MFLEKGQFQASFEHRMILDEENPTHGQEYQAKLLRYWGKYYYENL